MTRRDPRSGSFYDRVWEQEIPIFVAGGSPWWPLLVLPPPFFSVEVRITQVPESCIQGDGMPDVVELETWIGKLVGVAVDGGPVVGSGATWALLWAEPQNPPSSVYTLFKAPGFNAIPGAMPVTWDVGGSPQVGPDSGSPAGSELPPPGTPLYDLAKSMAIPPDLQINDGNGFQL